MKKMNFLKSLFSTAGIFIFLGCLPSCLRSCSDGSKESTSSSPESTAVLHSSPVSNASPSPLPVPQASPTPGSSPSVTPQPAATATPHPSPSPTRRAHAENGEEQEAQDPEELPRGEDNPNSLQNSNVPVPLSH